MYKLNTDSTIFNNDGQLVSQMRLYPGQNFSDLIGAFMPIFIMIGLVLSVSMLILICDFMKAYRKNKILTVNFRQQQQIVWSHTFYNIILVFFFVCFVFEIFFYPKTCPSLIEDWSVQRIDFIVRSTKNTSMAQIQLRISRCGWFVII